MPGTTSFRRSLGPIRSRSALLAVTNRSMSTRIRSQWRFLFRRHGNRLRLCGLFDRRGQLVQSGQLQGVLYPASLRRRFRAGQLACRTNLTFNYGVRWDWMEYWSEKYRQIPTFIPGEQSQVFTRSVPEPGLCRRQGRPEHVGSVEQPFFAAARDCVFAGCDGWSSRKDHWWTGKQQHPRRVWDLLFGD